MKKLSVSRRCVVCDQVFDGYQGSNNYRYNKCCSNACNGRLGVLGRGLQYWTELDTDFARRLVAEGMLFEEMAALMGFHSSTISLQIRRLGIPRPTPEIRWSPEEEELLKDLAPVMLASQISQLTGRSTNAIMDKIKRLKIERPASFYMEHGLSHQFLPPDLKEVIGLHKKLKRKLRDEEHRRLTATPV